MKKLFLALALLILAAAPARALSLASCTASTTPVAFGTYDPLSSAPNTASGTVTVTCDLLLGLSLAVSYYIDLSTGTGSYANRTLKSGTNPPILYNLYTDNTYSAIWGNNTAGTSRRANAYLLGVGGAATPFTVFGRILAGQTAKAGNYTDTILVTVTY